MKKGKEIIMDNGLTLERNLAISIINIFEGLLDEKEIDIPSDDREGNEEEARIYGTEYYDLEDSITELLKKYEIKEK